MFLSYNDIISYKRVNIANYVILKSQDNMISAMHNKVAAKEILQMTNNNPHSDILLCPS